VIEVVISYYDECDKNDTSDIDRKLDEENSGNTNTGTKPEISNKGVIPHITPIIPITLHSKEELTNAYPPKSDKSDTSDNNKSVTDENSNGQNGQLGNQNLGGSNASDDGNVNAGTKPDIPKVIDNEQQEDYAAYVERKKRTYEAMDKEQQKSAARQIFDELTPKNAEIGWRGY